MFRKILFRWAVLLSALLVCISSISCGSLVDIGGLGNDYPVVDNDTNEEEFAELDVIHYLFQQMSVHEIDLDSIKTSILATFEESLEGCTDIKALKIELLKAYAEATGDVYAAYYTKEELEALTAENQGDMEGIGVSVVNDRVIYNGEECAVLTIISVFQSSPALDAGLRVGDSIYAVVNDKGETQTVQELGHDAAVACVRGIAGTKAEFTVLRPVSGGEYTTVDFSIERKKITAETVTGRVYEGDPTIGILKISQFDLTTPVQFKATMDELISKGCTKFVFDVRYNPGGDLKSIEAVLSTLLQEGDTMISTVYKDGTGESDTVQEVTNLTGSYATCNVPKEDIGKYRGYQFAVLTNEYTASAAELFTSNLRDYELATLVGVTTYGKGCMQSMYNLSYFGVEGALKLTTAWYLPPSGENYHDIGISPDISVALDEALVEQYGNIYLIPDDVDPQMKAAIDALK